MTDQITVPRATWDAMREALEKSRSARTYSARIDAYECAVQALTAANAVSEPQATEPAPSTYEPIGWADWQGNMVTAFRQWSDGSSEEIVVYRKLSAAPEEKQ